METADHQNKPDMANSKAQEMYDRKGVDAILDVPTSSAALTVADVAKEKKKLYFNIGAGTTDLTGKSCNRYTFHYAYDTYMLANGTGTGSPRTAARTGTSSTRTTRSGRTWRSVLRRHHAAGGRWSPRTRRRSRTPTALPFLLKAPALNPKPDVLGTMQAGGELVNVVKQYNDSS